MMSNGAYYLLISTINLYTRLRYSQEGLETGNPFGPVVNPEGHTRVRRKPVGTQNTVFIYST